MRRISFLFLFLFSISAQAQNYMVELRSRSITPDEKSFKTFQFSADNSVQGKSYVVIQFYHTPTLAERKTIESQGIKLYGYLAHYAFMATVPVDGNYASVDPLVRSVFALDKMDKLDPYLNRNEIPDWAKRGANQIEVAVSFSDNLSDAKLRELLPASFTAELVFLPEAHAFRAIIPTQAINDLAKLPFINFIELYDDTIVPDDIRGRSSHRSNFIDRNATTGLNLRGAGINVGLNDDGIIGPHIDYQGRLAGQYITTNNGNHGDHCGGIIFGAGNLDPNGEGMASAANLHVYRVSGAYPTGYQGFDSVVTHYVTKNIRVISTSYSDGTNAGYTTRARNVDIQLRARPLLSYIFSAGNNGTSSSSYGAGAGWGNVTGGHKHSKNSIAVANLDYLSNLANSSSRGPAHDGRIKPDISAVGTNVWSTIDPNTYASFTGTSMSCPGVAGVVAQLLEGHKLLFGGTEAPAALIKACILNTGDELGNPGPDYKYGWGKINARRAYNTMVDQRFFLDSVSQNDSILYPVVVPAGVTQVRIMTYWTDKEATVNAARALVNNLDMSVTTPSSTVFLPWVLNPAPNPTTLNANAVRAVDTLNNMEQVTIDNPAAGTYAVKVKGKNVPFGPQQFYITYEFITDTPKLTYPIGKENFVPGQTETIRWDANDNGNTFSLQYSQNGGTTWTNLSTNLAQNVRSYDWVVPNIVTGQALVRITRNGITSQSGSNFSIIGRPTGLVVDWVCGDSMKVSYSSVTGATGYKVSVLGNTYMDSVGFSTTTSCIAHLPAVSTGGWFTVQALSNNDCEGRRQVAVTYPAANFNCNQVSIDLAVVSIDSLSTTSDFSCGTGTKNYPLIITVKNNHFAPVNNIQVGASVNGVQQLSGTITASIPAGSTISYTFPGTLTLSNGANTIKAYLINATDPLPTNDTATTSKFYQVQTSVNPFLAQAALMDFETQNLCDTTANCGTTVCPIGNGWWNMLNDKDDNIDWRVHTGPTPSRASTNLTGPLAAPSGAKYAYLEADFCDEDTAVLLSPCLMIPTNLNAPILRYEVHMFGSDIGALYVDIFDGVSWNNAVQSLVGNQGDIWRSMQVPLAAYAGKTINIRFRGTTSAGPLGDMALDKIEFASNQSIKNQEGLLASIELFPNPTQENVTVAIPTGIVPEAIQILDASGRMISNKRIASTAKSSTHTVNLKGLATGVYFIKVQTQQGTWNEKILKY